MDWQLPLVLLCLAAAALYVVRRTWLTWRGRGGGCGGCKCSKPEAAATRKDALIPVNDLTLRLRRPR